MNYIYIALGFLFFGIGAVGVVLSNTPHARPFCFWHHFVLQKALLGLIGGSKTQIYINTTLKVLKKTVL